MQLFKILKIKFIYLNYQNGGWNCLQPFRNYAFLSCLLIVIYKDTKLATFVLGLDKMNEIWNLWQCLQKAGGRRLCIAMLCKLLGRSIGPFFGYNFVELYRVLGQVGIIHRIRCIICMNADVCDQGAVFFFVVLWQQGDLQRRDIIIVSVTYTNRIPNAKIYSN